MSASAKPGEAGGPAVLVLDGGTATLAEGLEAAESYLTVARASVSRLVEGAGRGGLNVHQFAAHGLDLPPLGGPPL